MAGGVVGELQACPSGEGHKLSLYLGHWDATAAAVATDKTLLCKRRGSHGHRGWGG